MRSKGKRNGQAWANAHPRCSRLINIVIQVAVPERNRCEARPSVAASAGPATDIALTYAPPFCFPGAMSMTTLPTQHCASAGKVRLRQVCCYPPHFPHPRCQARCEAYKAAQLVKTARAFAPARPAVRSARAACRAAAAPGADARPAALHQGACVCFAPMHRLTFVPTQHVSLCACSWSLR